MSNDASSRRHRDRDPAARAPSGGDDSHRDTRRDDADARVRDALGRLAGQGRRSVLERAEAAVDDLDAAVTFVESGGLDELAAAVDATDDPVVQERGQRALAEFRRFRAAARGEPLEGRTSGGRDCSDSGETPPESADEDGYHFRRGRGTHLRGDAERSSR